MFVGVQLGERVTFEGMEGEPAGAAAIKKKKILEAILPDLSTDGNCVACYKGVAMCTTAGPCTVKGLTNCHIN